MSLDRLPGLRVLCTLALAVVGVAFAVGPTTTTTTHQLTVARGLTVYLRRSDVGVAVAAGSRFCKIVVDKADPLTLRVGHVFPEVFDCDFPEDVVRYVHDGNPSLQFDHISLVVHQNSDGKTISQTVRLAVEILPPVSRIFDSLDSRKQLTVNTELSPFSNVITSDVLRFHYGFANGSVCTLTVIENKEHRPKYLLSGELVTSDGSPVRNLSSDCRDFLTLGLCYKYAASYSLVEIDYILLTAEVEDFTVSGVQPVRENLFLPVRILNGVPNTPPIITVHSHRVLQTDQFQALTLTPALFSANDNETVAHDLLFVVNRTENTEDGGYLSHHRSPWRAISSFYQNDLSKGHIIFQPPSNVPISGRPTEVVLTAVDSQFVSSLPVRLRINVRHVGLVSPKVVYNGGLFVEQGQTACIGQENLRILDAFGMEHVEIQVLRGGPVHGKLKLHGLSVSKFNWTDLDQCNVVYEHAAKANNLSSDELLLRISNLRHSTRVKFIITVLPGHSKPPTVELNSPTEVRENGYSQITTLRLHVGDLVYGSNGVQYNIVSPPRFGEIFMAYRPMTRGRLVLKFTQLDIERGHIWYHHLGGRSSSHDSFQFVLRIGNEPVTNATMHDVIIRPYHVDRPPQKLKNSSLSLIIRETEAASIGRDRFAFEDLESPGDDVVYVVTCQPFIIGSSVTADAGRITYHDGDGFYDKNTTILPLRSFTQSMIDAGLVAYVPPLSDIGRHPLYVQFIFSASDLHGNFIVDQRFNVTVLPADNQHASLAVQVINVTAGESFLLTTDLILNADIGNEESQLSFILEREPRHGYLSKENTQLVEGDKFSADDFAKSRIKYVNDGSSARVDGFDVIVLNQRNRLSKHIPINIMTSSRHDRQIQTLTMSVVEGGNLTLRANDLNLKDINDTSQLYMFDVVQSPSHILVMVGGAESTTFTSSDVLNGSVKFVHVGGEMGSSPRKDLMTLGLRHRQQDTPSLIGIDINILPVDNSPPELIIGSHLFVMENGEPVSITSDIISAIDADTVPDQLVFFVVKSPSWGRLEKRVATVNRRGRSSSHRLSGKRAINSFTMTDLRNGMVKYVRSNSSQSKPMRDYIGIQVSDGRRNSSMRHLEVAFDRTLPSINLDFVLDDVEVLEGGEKFFTIHHKVDAAGTPSNIRPEVMLSLVSRPLNGQVLLVLSARQNNGVQELEMSSVALSDLVDPDVRLMYRHDGSETSSDHFRMSLSTGNRTETRMCQVLVLPVNDAKPILKINSVLRVPFRSLGIITSSHLQAEDDDSKESEIRYIIVASPKKGTLEYREVSSSSNPVEIKTGDSFSQADVNAERVFFVHSKSIVDTSKDNFIFQLTDGTNVVSHETFEIEITMPSSPGVVLWNRGMTIPEGNTVILSPDMLSLVGVSNEQQDRLIYRISRSPKCGFLGLNNESSLSVVMPVPSFTQADLEAGRVFYAQTIKISNNVDSFEFQIVDEQARVLSEDRFNIRIEKPAVAMPVIDVNVPLTVIHGYKAALTDVNLHVTVDRNTQASEIVYAVVESPRHGQIWKLGATVMNFTQNDINEGLMEYKSDSSDESMMDYFLFTVATKSRNGLMGNTTVDKPQFFSILIQPITKIPPTIVTIESPARLMPLGSDRFGFLFTSDNLKATHPLFDSRDVVYQLKSRPQHGYLEHLGSRRPIKRKFSQKDIDDQRIAYVLNEQTRATSDNFTFRVLDLNRNAIDNLRMHLEWSIIEFSQSRYVVCEDAQLLAVNITRVGAVNQSASVQVQVKSMSAKEKVDFVEKSNSTVEFKPGDTEISWMIEIINDRIKEGDDEKFKISLENVTNAIMGQVDKTQIHIIDFEDGFCVEYIGMISKNGAARTDPQTQRGSGPHKVGAQPTPSSTNRQKSFSPSGDFLPTANEDDDYGDSASSSGLLNSDLSFYMPPDQRSPPVAHPGSSGPVVTDGARNKHRGGGSSSNQPGKNIRKSGAKSPGNIERGKLQSVPQPCTRDTQGLLYFDLESSKMYRCSDHQWQHWGWGLTGATSAPPSRQPGSVRRAASDSALSRVSPVEPESTEVCPTGWTLGGNLCYFVVTTRLSWNAAQQKCQSLNARLTHIESKQHLSWLWKLNDRRHFWAGIHLESIDGSRQWRNTDLTVPRYFEWRTGSPCGGSSRSCSSTRGHLCVAIGSHQQMVDRSCDSGRLRSICAKSVTARVATRRRRISRSRSPAVS